MIQSTTICSLLCFLVWTSTLFAHSPTTICFSFLHGAAALDIKESLTTPSDSTLVLFSELKFYISKIQFLKNGAVVLEEENSYHLINARDTNSLRIPIVNSSNVVFDELRFQLGIDSATNVSGAMGGDLDPTKGMYWTWQSGYINIKMEGRSALCTTRNNEFQFHLGGYVQPHYCLQTVNFRVQNSKSIHLSLDVQRIVQQIDLSTTNHIMSPNAQAVLLSKIVARSITLLEN